MVAQGSIEDICAVAGSITGDFLAGQQFCGRLSSGRANYVATKYGDITADAEGRVFVVGRAAAGLPSGAGSFSAMPSSSLETAISGGPPAAFAGGITTSTTNTALPSASVGEPAAHSRSISGREPA